MSLFGGLYVGTSGLRTSQNALNTVAHNLSNVNTSGYTRQQVAQSDTIYQTFSRAHAIGPSQTGEGVQYSECRRLRHYFLDQSYRTVSGRYAYYEASYAAIMEVEDIMGELNGASFKDSLTGLWNAFQELSKTPSDATYMSLLVSKAALFAENANAVSKSYQEYQLNLNSQIKNTVDKINAIGKQIDTLNREIGVVEGGRTEHANDLRDARDLLLDQLSEFGDITYQEDIEGRVSVRFGGVDFITTAGAYQIGMKQDLETGFYTPYWEQNVVWREGANGERYQDISGAKLFNLTEEISTDKGTDIGGLRALLLARGDHVADYTDLEIGVMTDQKLAALGITSNQYDATSGLQYYNDYISKSIMMNVQGEFDNLVHHISTVINQVIADQADPKSGYLCNPDGTPIQMFQKINGPAYTKQMLTQAQADELNKNGKKAFQVYDQNGQAVAGSFWVFVEENANAKETLYSAANIKMNQKLIQTPTLLGFLKEDGSTDYNIGKTFIQAFDEAQLYLNPNATRKSSFQNCYIDLMGQVATSGDVFQGLYAYQQLSTQQIEASRQSYVGVSADEELGHMIMYQNAYNAASRYINVINDLLDSLIAIGR